MNEPLKPQPAGHGEAVSELLITALGSGGEGMAVGPDGPIYVAYTLEGELVDARLMGGRAKLVEVLRASKARREPVCRHFTVCGGCLMQHMNEESYTDWKRTLVETTLKKKGLEAHVCDVFAVGHKARRRAVLSAAKEGVGDGQRCVIGFHSAGTHDIVDMGECPVLADEITQMLPRLRKLLLPVLAHAANIRIDILLASNGIAIDLIGLPAKLARTQIARLSGEAAHLGAIQVTIDRDPIYSLMPPAIVCGPAKVVPPPGVFVQASCAAEEEMVRLITGAVPKRAKRIGDLFCGFGAFSFPLATRAKVVAFDSDARAIKAMKTAILSTKGIKPMEARVRDLFQEPLSRKELDEFDLIVFDPPRAGAKLQAANLARSKVPVVVAVSCNPATFARDAQTLVDGGYSLQNVTPIDQFVYAAHVELVAVFRR